MKTGFPISTLFFFLIAGIGNVKHGKWQGTLTYFSAIILLGVGLLFAEQRFIEPYYNPTQTVRTFAVLMYIAFAFFWNGTNLLGSETRKRIFSQDEDSP